MISVVLRRGSGALVELVGSLAERRAKIYDRSKDKLLGECVVGTSSDRPDPVTSGKLFFAVDTQTLFLCAAGEWTKIASLEKKQTPAAAKTVGNIRSVKIVGRIPDLDAGLLFQ